MAAIRQIFREDPNVAVVQEQSGMVRITIGSVPTALLQTSVQSLELSPDAQYSAPSALVKIANAPELNAAERRLDVYPISGVIDIIAGGPSPGKPHPPGLMQSVTVDAVLHSPVRTFKGIGRRGAWRSARALGGWGAGEWRSARALE